MRAIAVLAVLLLGASFQDDVLQLKDDGRGEPQILVGQILAIGEKSVDFQDKKLGKMTIPIDSIEPYSIYRAKSARIDVKSGKAHLELGEWCSSAALYAAAIREFELAKEADASLAGSADEKIKSAKEEDARIKLDEAKRLILQKRYEGAVKLLGYIIKNYGDTPYAEKAKEESDKIAEAVKAENEEKQKMLEGKKKADDQKKDEQKVAGDKKVVSEILGLIEQAKKSYNEGLDWEGKDNHTKCRQSWENSERTLETAKTRVAPLLKSDDVNTIKEASELDKEVTAWLVKTCWRLGRHYADNLMYPEALKYINKALALPHDEFMDRLLNELLLTVTQLRMRKRAAGGGY